ncbi:hypothetical protein ACKFKG_03675 [Phormidesmis sp. 146-35]
MIKRVEGRASEVRSTSNLKTAHQSNSYFSREPCFPETSLFDPSIQN